MAGFQSITTPPSLVVLAALADLVLGGLAVVAATALGAVAVGLCAPWLADDLRTTGGVAATAVRELLGLGLLAVGATLLCLCASMAWAALEVQEASSADSCDGYLASAATALHLGSGRLGIAAGSVLLPFLGWSACNSGGMCAPVPWPAARWAYAEQACGGALVSALFSFYKLSKCPASGVL